MLRIFMHPVVKLVNRSMARNDAKADAGKALADGVTEFADIDYVGDGARGHLLDVYVPTGGESLPVLVDIHGGGLIYGYKEINKRFCYDMAKLGFVVVSVSYRLAPEAALPQQVGDVTAAFRWVTVHAADYTANKNIYVAGDSAGALLALYAAATADSAAVREAFGVPGGGLRPRGMFLVSGMYDLKAGGYMRHLSAYALGRGYRAKAWAKYLDLRNLLAEYTPPRSFLTTSREDEFCAHTLNYVKLLDELGLPYELDFKEKLPCAKGETPRVYPHVYPVRYPERAESADVLARAAAYIRGE